MNINFKRPARSGIIIAVTMLAVLLVAFILWHSRSRASLNENQIALSEQFVHIRLTIDVPDFIR